MCTNLLAFTGNSYGIASRQAFWKVRATFVYGQRGMMTPKVQHLMSLSIALKTFYVSSQRFKCYAVPATSTRGPLLATLRQWDWSTQGTHSVCSLRASAVQPSSGYVCPIHSSVSWVTFCLHCYLLYTFKTGLKKKWTEMNKNQERNIKNELKSIVNRYVLRSDLKDVTASFRSLGREF